MCSICVSLVFPAACVHPIILSSLLVTRLHIPSLVCVSLDIIHQQDLTSSCPGIVQTSSVLFTYSDDEHTSVLSTSPTLAPPIVPTTTCKVMINTFYFKLETLAEVKVWLIMAHSLLWRHIVLLTVGVYSSNHRVVYTIGISMTRRFRNSVDPSVCPFVTLTKKPTPPSLLTVE